MGGDLKGLISAWRGRDLLSRMLEEFRGMLVDAEWMFTTVGDLLARRQKPEDVHDKFFAVDKSINASEKDIRRRIVEHLSLRGDADVPACLVMMSVVKDAERLGDYAKNIYEVACLYPGDPASSAIGREIEALRARDQALFAQVSKAFSEVDGSLAATIIAEAREIRDRCDDMIPRLFAEDLPSRDAVAWALLSRHYKRVAAHLANICTSVTGPVYELDHAAEVEACARKTYGAKP